MNDLVDNAEANLPTLGEMRRLMKASKKIELDYLTGTNLGHPTLATRMAIGPFVEFSRVANATTIGSDEDLKDEPIRQRELRKAHAKSLASYSLRGLVQSAIATLQAESKQVPPVAFEIRNSLPGGPYQALQPITAAIRNCEPGGTDLPLTPDQRRIILYSTVPLWIIDGQHRRHAFLMVLAFLEYVLANHRYPPKNGHTASRLYEPVSTGPGGQISREELDFWAEVQNVALTEATVTVEIHLGIGSDAELQLFADLNLRTLKVSTSDAAKHDASDSVRNVTLEMRNDNIFGFPIHDTSDEKHWDDEGMTLNDIHQINRILSIGAATSKEPTKPGDVDVGQLTRFWKVVQSTPSFGEKNQRHVNVLTQSPFIKGLALAVYAMSQSNGNYDAQLRQLYDDVVSGKIDFSHSNPLWRTLFMKPEEREELFPGLSEFLATGGQFKPGEIDTTNTWIRYGAATNDIAPRIGDLFRYRYGLKPRGYVKNAQKKLEAAEKDGAGAVA